MTTDQIIKAALALPDAAKIRLADELVASIELGEYEQIDPTLAREIERRIDEYDEGKVVARPVEDVLRDLRRKFQ